MAAFLVLAGTALIYGIVVDPQKLPVPAARVKLSCDDHIESVVTDGRGRFVFSRRPPYDRCRISVARDGFEPIDEPLAVTLQPLVLRLRLAKLRAAVNVVSRAPPWPSLGAVTLSDVDFTDAVGSTTDLIRYAKLLAGATGQSTVVYVDGLPANTLPTVDMIARISVNGDPVSAEFADGNITAVQIVTKAPPRTLRFQLGSDLLAGGGDPLSLNSHAASRLGTVGASGGIPHAPITFSAAMNMTRSSRDVSIQTTPIGPSQSLAGAAPVTDDVRSMRAAVYLAPIRSFTGNVTYSDFRATEANVGVGGLTTEEAGTRSSTDSRETRVAVRKALASLTYDVGAVVRQQTANISANAIGPGITILGSSISGGAAMTVANSARSTWMVKQVVRSLAADGWSAGVIVNGVGNRHHDVPNAAGMFQFSDSDNYTAALAGAPTAAWFLTRGDTTVNFSSLSASLFAQKPVVHTAHAEVSTGIRLDYQSRLGTIMSPRISTAFERHHYMLRASAGLFVREVPDFVYVNAIEDDGAHLQQFFALNVPLGAPTAADLTAVSTVHRRLSADLARSKQAMTRVSIERPIDKFVPSVEYVWTEDSHLLGAERAAGGTSWIDTTTSDRSARAHRIRTQLQYAQGRYRMSAQYQWTHARDNASGLFSFPAQPSGIDAEWARSAGISPHEFTFVASASLPGATSLILSDVWRSSAPYDVTTGLDVLGNGLFNDRGGLARNSGDGPAFHSLSLMAFKAVPLWKTTKRRRPLPRLNLGVDIDNVLNARNVMSVGSIVGSQRFGLPLVAFPGRSLRFSATVR